MDEFDRLVREFLTNFKFRKDIADTLEEFALLRGLIFKTHEDGLLAWSISDPFEGAIPSRHIVTTSYLAGADQYVVFLHYIARALRPIGARKRYLVQVATKITQADGTVVGVRDKNRGYTYPINAFVRSEKFAPDLFLSALEAVLQRATELVPNFHTLHVAEVSEIDYQ